MSQSTPKPMVVYGSTVVQFVPTSMYFSTTPVWPFDPGRGDAVDIDLCGAMSGPYACYRKSGHTDNHLAIGRSWINEGLAQKGRGDAVNIDEGRRFPEEPAGRVKLAKGPPKRPLLPA